MLDIEEELEKLFTKDGRYGLITFSTYIEYGRNECELEIHDRELNIRITLVLVENKNIEEIEEKIKKTLIMS